MKAIHTPWQTQLASFMLGAMLGLAGPRILLAVIRLL